MKTVEDATAAATLIGCGLRPKQMPTRDVVYGDLVRRYREDPAFAQVVNGVAGGLGLRVLDVSPAGGVVLAAGHDSVFEIKMETYARQAKIRERRDLEKVLHGIVHLAVAALAFPRPADLANDTYVGRVTVEQVDLMVREACRLLNERVEAADPEADTPELEQVWRAYARRPEVAATKDGRAAADSTRGMVARALRFLAEQGFLVPVASEPDGLYRTTHRYQIQVRELAADRAFGELLALGVVSIVDGSGRLRTATDTLEG